ncbi:MAG TPA: 50S ribosomal protein L17 [Candidatus Paceibacterota bacterium]|jgi:large subunit ribosomal protein L17|nr:50S ribosomal protein L17 [Candidatus Paceibacterota bacterium]HOO48207.1 50S ribosomal protein L17 [Candidatus Paceibacterota bacterium]HOX90918.1 50S ribosomal protein L17 [Candidatus Paceibacterota bacterium]HPC12309.1 50S ribosomal protein L17 [Candidatus Paceibacterota bacterium]HPK13933.1 50S ribosomal protein L17 [Candidatus Paceibacterota bacterium]
MRHHNNVRKFGRNKNQRNALMKGLMLSLIAHGKIETTEAKAKELRPMIEKLITKANVGTLASNRLVISRLYNLKSEANKLINEIAPKYKGRNGGYTRITKLPRRTGDASKMAIIEFI